MRQTWAQRICRRIRIRRSGRARFPERPPSERISCVPIRGLGTIYSSWPRFWTQYDSIQTSFNRRFSRGWQAGLNWTWSLRSTGNTSSPLHFVHNADGSISDDPRQPELDELLSHSAASGNVVNTGNRPHIIKGNFVWELPKLNGYERALKALGAVVNDWQFSGVYTGGSGATYDARYSYQQNGANVNLTGSPNYLARIVLKGDPGSGCSSNRTSSSTRRRIPGRATSASAMNRARICCEGAA